VLTELYEYFESCVRWLFVYFLFLIQHSGMYNFKVLTDALNMCRKANTIMRMTVGNVLDFKLSPCPECCMLSFG